MTIEELFEAHALHVFHHHEILPSHLAEVVGLDDVGMDQIRDEAGFADEVLLKLLEGGVFLANQLDGDPFPEFSGAVLHGLIHDAHAPFCNGADQFVVNLVNDVFDGAHERQG